MKFTLIILVISLLLYLVWKLQIIDLLRFPDSVKIWQIPNDVGFIILSPKGTMFLTQKRKISPSGRRSTMVTDSKQVDIRRLSDGEIIQTFQVFSVWNVVFNADDSLIAAASKKGQIQIWRISDGEMLHSFELDNPTRSSTQVIALSSNGQTLLVKVLVREKLSQPPSEQLKVCNVSTAESFTLKNEYKCISSDARGELVALSREGEGLTLYQLKDETPLLQLQTEAKQCSKLTFSADGRQLAFLSRFPQNIADYKIHIHNTSDGSLQHILYTSTGSRNPRAEYVNNFTFSPDGHYLAASYSVGRGKKLFTFWGDGPLASHGRIRIWNIKNGRLIATLRGHKGGTHTIAFSPDGNLLASAGRDGTIRFWRVPPRNYTWLWLLGGGALIGFVYSQRTYLLNWFRF